MIQTRGRKSPLWLALDVVALVVFVVIGRATHAKGENLNGIISTLWPFAGGLAVGWLYAKAWRRPTALYRTGVPAVIASVALGMVFRVLAGQGTAIAFVFVAFFFLAFCMLGWRFSYSAWRAVRVLKRFDALRQVLRGVEIGR